VPELIPRIRRPTQHRRPELARTFGFAQSTTTSSIRPIMSAMLVVTELVETVIARFGTSPSRPARGWCYGHGGLVPIASGHRPLCGPSLFCDGGWITGTRGVSVVRCPEEGLTYDASLLERSSFGAGLVTAYRAL
jgi:hypothetical protein